MSNFWTRAITGSVFVVVLISSAIFSKLLLAGLFLLFTVVGTYEYFNCVDRKKSISVNRIGGYTLSITSFFLVIAVPYFDLPLVFISLLIPLVSILFVLELFRLKENGFANILHTIMPTIYVAIPFALFVFSNEMVQQTYPGSHAAEFTLMFFFVLWANDTGAYLTGRSLGRTKLFPKVSPNKTWEGSIGGAVLAIIVAYSCGAQFTLLPQTAWIVIALIIVVFGSLGDLVESMLKRSYGIKDSGKFLPGHGGVLDRFDGLLIASPVVFTFLLLKTWLL